MRTLLALLLLSTPVLAEVPVDLLAIIEKTRTPEPAPVVVPPVVVPVVPLVEPPVAARLGYPVRGGWWTGCSSWRHMLDGEHAGKFDVMWLQTLTNAELQSLHSDDHEGRVNWSSVKRPIARRLGGYYEWRCDGKSCGWKWVSDLHSGQVPQRRRVFR